MISICIPVYNYDVTDLVNELAEQADALSVESEIILIDDCSSIVRNEHEKNGQKTRFFALPENVGRARIRNLFIDYAKYDYLLFLDCDSLVEKSDFLTAYIDAIRQQPKVVCGGRVYPEKRPERAKLLRWKYGVERESQSAEVRKMHPNKSFMTNNFLIQKSVLQAIKFDERIRQYGHEDTLFGLALQQKGITVSHIENPVVNGDIETNDEFLRKTRESIASLVAILSFPEYERDLLHEITLLCFYNKLKWAKKPLKMVFSILQSPIELLLKNGFVSLRLFDFYKLGILINRNSKR